MKKVAVIGAGISGLTCAYELQKKGFEVEVFEREAFVGGRMSSRTKDGLRFDIGANHLINLYTEMRQYCQELGVEWYPFTFVNYRLFKDGKLHSVTDTLPATDKLRLGKAYLKYKSVPMTYLDASTLVEYDTESAYVTAEREIGQAFADDIVDTYVGVYQFHRATEVSGAALLSQLMSTKNQNADWYLHLTRGGMIALPEAMAKKMTVHLETPVTSLTANESSVTVTTKDGEKEFDLCVVATTATIAKKIYQNPTEAQKNVMDGAQYAPSTIIAFTMPDHTFGNPTNNTEQTVSAVWVPYSESKLVSSYSNESEKGPELMKDGKTLLLVFFREDGAIMYQNDSDEEIYEAAKKEMLRLCPFITEETLTPHDIYRWDEAMPKFYAGSLKSVKGFLDSGEQGAQNVWFTGDYLNAPWTEGALRCGQRVAQQITEKLQ